MPTGISIIEIMKSINSTGSRRRWSQAGKLLSFIAMFILFSACDREGTAEVELYLEVAGSKSEDPPGDVVRDVSILVFGSSGLLEESLYFEEAPQKVSLGMMSGAEVTLAVCANLGKRVSTLSMEELGDLRYHMAYPDEYSMGMPLTALCSFVPSAGMNRIAVPLEHIMAKISVRIDRRDLDSGVSIKVRSLQIGNCPRSALLFSDNSCRGLGDVFPEGFIKTWGAADGLNIDDTPGISRYVSLYMLENIQGPSLNRNACSYVEIKAEYDSPERHSTPGEYLIYRFYPGESDGDYSIRRGANLRFTLHPVGDGLAELPWAVDSSALVEKD